MNDNKIWENEEMFWLGDANYYEQHLSEHAWMVFAPPVGILERNQIISSLTQGPRWQSVIFSDKKLKSIKNGVMMLSYLATAERKDLDTPYKALCSSAYSMEGNNWLMFFHQQTPV
ncbi:MAG: hypothetical protein RBT01_02795 [Anaerolineaceae bacterium]|nr:hypothetical protein [Anaerolineaceae bacterium]